MILKSIKLTPLFNLCKQIPVFCIGFRGIIPSNFCHSLVQCRTCFEFRIPKQDYSLKVDVAIANRTISRLCDEGKIDGARQVFDEMPERDVISWTALMTGYIKHGLIEEARELFDRVDSDKNVVTWTALLSGYLAHKRISEAQNLFEEMPVKNIVAWNTMINGFFQNGMIEEALELFKKINERNVVSWNIVISGLMNCGKLEDAEILFHKIPVKNAISWTIMISGLARNGRIDEARLLFDQMTTRNVVSWNAMITGYAQNMRLNEANSLFHAMPERNIHSWNTMITTFLQNCEFEKARSLFNKMPVKNVVSWTAMINGCVRYGECEEALRVFCFMLRDGRIRPNEGTFVSCLSACSDLACLCEGMQVHQLINKSVHQKSAFVLSTLINMYAKCGELYIATRIFDHESRRNRDVVSWNSMIAAYAHHGCGTEAIKLFHELRMSALNPNSSTFIALLSACSHAGLVEEGLHYIEILLKDEYIQLNDEHYTCLIDLYGRAGHLNEAFELINKFPSIASPQTLGALLSGCNIYGNSDIRELIAGKLLSVEPENSGVHALVSNAYTNNGKREEAEMVKSRIKKKQPGSSWIEIGNKFYVFVAGERFSGENESLLLHSLLINLHEELNKIGPEKVGLDHDYCSTISIII